MSDGIGVRAHCSFLSDSALEDCVRRCLSNPGYKVGIFVTNNEEKERILQKFTTGVFRLFSNEAKEMLGNGCGGSYIYFKNFSYIKVDKVEIGVRGFRLNEILIDEKISNDIVDAILCPYLINYNPLQMTDYRQRQIQQDVDMLFTSKDVVAQQLLYEQNDGFINDNFFGVEENNELDEFINSFKINKNT